MAKGIGRRVQVGFAKETSRGTAESAAEYWLPWAELSVDDKDERVQLNQSYGVIEESLGEEIVKQWAELTLGGPVSDTTLGLLLLAVFGGLSSDANADASGNVYDHTYSVGQSAQHQALSLFVDDPLGGQDYKHALGMIDTFELTYERGEYIRFNAGLRALKGETATLTPSTTAENRFRPQDLTFKVASAKSGLTGASAVVIKSATITIEKNLEDDDVLGNVAPVDFLNKQFMISGTIEAMWQNESDFKTASLAGTDKALRFDLVDSNTTIGTAANPQLRIDLAKVNFRPVTRAIALDDMIMQTVEFKAHYSTADTEMVEAILTNLVTSY